MANTYKQILCAIVEEDPSPALCEHIMNRIAHMEMRRLQARTAAHGIVLAAAVIMFVPIAKNFFSNIAGSEAMQYVSLLASDWSTLVNNWKNIFLSIAASWPLIWSILLLGAFIIFINSLRRIVMNASALSTYKHAHLPERRILSI